MKSRFTINIISKSPIMTASYKYDTYNRLVRVNPKTLKLNLTVQPLDSNKRKNKNKVSNHWTHKSGRRKLW